VTLAGLLVTGKEVLTSRREPMVFVSFEDEHSVFETVFFPQAFRECYPRLDGGGVFLVSGRVMEEQGALALHAEKVLGLERGTDPAGAPGPFASPLAAGGIWGGWGPPARAAAQGTAT
jgi:DNA polymerase III alpha subunit